MTDFGGRFPARYEDILSLAGVGEYTAGAISSIAFGIPVPAVDGNVLRVVARITGDSGDILKPETKGRMRAALLAVMPRDFPGALNQALMELGALVCLPNGAPLCSRCPAAPSAPLCGRSAFLLFRSRPRNRPAGWRSAPSFSSSTVER